MAYKITDDCVMCGTCLSECPNQAIYEGDVTNRINPDKCCECLGDHESPQCASVCIVNACIPDPNHRESKEQLLKKWKKLHPGCAPPSLE